MRKAYHKFFSEKAETWLPIKLAIPECINFMVIYAFSFLSLATYSLNNLF